MSVSKLYIHICFFAILFIAIVSLSFGEEDLKFDQSDGESSYEIAKENLKTIFAKEIVSGSFLGNAKRTLSDSELDPTLKFFVQPPTDRRLINSRSEVDSDSQDNQKYINEWVVHLRGGQTVAESIIEALGYEFKGPVNGFNDKYVVSHRLNHHNHKRESKSITKEINSHVEVLWAEQQIARKRVKRKMTFSKQIRGEFSENPQLVTEKTVNELVIATKERENLFNDALWKHQWYLYDSRIMEGLPELDLKVIPVWKAGITGKGVKVLIIDDGLEWKHKDIIGNYDPTISYDFNNDDTDPSPRMDKRLTNSHGTRCAGEIVMHPNNTKCGVGIAYGSKIGGIRALDGDVTDKIEGMSLAWGIKHAVEVVSCSWGPVDDGKSVEGPGTLAQEALYRGVTEGRSGKGIIYVWAAGNGGYNNDNCNCDGYASSRYTVSIGSASESGVAPWYGEHCASTLASTYSSGAYSDQKIVTTDVNDECTIDFSGTSAATPLGAGIIALALEANPSLTWRDVQHAIVLTSEWQPLSTDKDWKRNGKGLLFNNKFGFGLMNAEALVKAVKSWTSVPDSVICKINANVSEFYGIQSGKDLEIGIMVNCTSPLSLISLEHVEIAVSLNHTRRGCLSIDLISSFGTITKILTQRKNDDSSKGFQNWTFTSVHTWGEDPSGIWKVIIQDTSIAKEVGFVNSLSLILHGTSTVPEVFTSLIKNT